MLDRIHEAVSGGTKYFIKIACPKCYCALTGINEGEELWKTLSDCKKWETKGVYSHALCK
jgi:hypothetical protein